MAGKQQLLDRFTSVDELLASIYDILKKQYEKNYEIFYLTYPNDGSRATFAVGTTALDFAAGTIKFPDGSVDNMSSSLRKQKKDFMRSFAINCDQEIVVQLDGNNKAPVRANVWGEMTFQQFTTARITTIVETTGYIHASTNPDTLHKQTGEAIIKGDYSGALKAVKVDENGQMYVAMTGQSLDIGNLPSDYMKSADVPSDYFKADDPTVIKGDEDGTKHEIAVDSSGVMLSRMKGAYGSVLKDILLDDTGIMLSRMKGSNGSTLKDITVDDAGNMISVMKGDLGDGTLSNIKVDANGQLYIVMTGQSLNVDNLPSDYFKSDESAVVKGADGATKRLIAVDSSGILLSRMKGAYGGALKDIAVDTSGNMISVMKGDYEGALKTWKVDDQGRGEMFINDPADVRGNIRTMGLAEHAARVHAPPITFDRRGDVLRWIDFESGTPNYNVVASGATVYNRTTEVACTENFSMKATIPYLETFSIQLETNDFHVSRIGAQNQFSSDDSDLNIAIVVGYYTGSAYIHGRLSYNLDTGVLEYLDSSGNTQTITTLTNYHSKYDFSTFKLVVNFNTNYYERAIAFGDEYDLSAYALKSDSSSIAKHLEILNEAWTKTSGTNDIYIDNIILTENEPVN